MFTIIPYLIASAVFFILFALGLGLIVTSRERVLERFGEFYFALTHRSYDETSEISDKTVVILSRVGGAICLLFSFSCAWFIATRMMGS